MRHNEKIKMMIATGAIILGTNSFAQNVAYQNSWINTADNANTSIWNEANNWELPSGSHFVPQAADPGFEYVSISNGHAAFLKSEVPTVIAIYLGELEGQIGTLNVSAGGSVIADATDTDVTESMPLPGFVVAGLHGSGAINVSGGTLIGHEGVSIAHSSNSTGTVNVTGGLLESQANFIIGSGGTGLLTLSGAGTITAGGELIVSGPNGGSGTFNINGGTVNTVGTFRVGAGGGEAAFVNMTAGTINITEGEFDLGGDGNGTGTLNMSAGTINIQGADADWNLGGITGAKGVANLLGTAVVNAPDLLLGFDQGTLATMGTGQLNMSGSSAVNINTFAMLGTTGNNGTQLNITENAKITIAGDASIDRLFNINTTEANAVTVGGSLAITANGKLQTLVSSSAHSVIQVTGDVALGGTLSVNASGFTPTQGQSWTVITAGGNITGSFADYEGIAGQGLGISHKVVGSNVNAVVSQVLTARVNSATGIVELVDYIGGLEIISYAVRSASGQLNPAAFTGTGMADWLSANSGQNALNELNLVGSTEFSAGKKINIGKVLSQLEFGQSLDTDGIEFEYLLSDGSVRKGNLEITALKNNLVLHVDSATGEIVLQNHSMQTVDLLSYIISSNGGSLDSVGWDSMTDQGTTGWAEGTNSDNTLSELNLSEMLTLNSGDIVSLGNAFDITGLQDLDFSFLIGGQEIGITGVVEYDTTAFDVSGDYDLDGDVDADDLAIVQAGFGTTYSLSALFAVRNGSSGATALVAVPEPTSLALLTIAFAGLARRKN